METVYFIPRLLCPNITLYYFGMETNSCIPIDNIDNLLFNIS